MSELPPEHLQLHTWVTDEYYLEPTEERGRQLVDMALSFLSGIGAKPDRVLASGFDGGEHPEETIRQPQDELYGIDMTKWNIFVNNMHVDEYAVHNPALTASHSHTHCIGFFDRDQLRPKDAETVDRLPVYVHPGTGSVWDALIGIMVFKQSPAK